MPFRKSVMLRNLPWTFSADSNPCSILSVSNIPLEYSESEWEN